MSAEGKVFQTREQLMFETICRIEELAFSHPADDPNKKISGIRTILTSFEINQHELTKKLVS